MNIDAIINNKKQLLIENYFDLQKEAEKKYGENTLVFIEIGSFYEIYQYDNIGKAEEISKSLNIILTKKNKNINEVTIRNPYLCGIPTVSLEKHLQKLISENKWTIILIEQEGRPPNISRKLSKIISPGTNVDFLTSDDNLYIASIFIDKNEKEVYSAGLTLIDLSIGTTLVYENYGLSNDKEIAIDEINQILSNYNVSEIIITSSIEKEFILNKLIKYDIPIIYKNEEELKDTLNINYQNELIKHSYKTNTQLSPIEELDLERMPFTINALSILLEFIIEHNKIIGTRLQKPETIYSQKYMYLGNNPLFQLDIFKKDEIDVLDIVNNGISAIGKRFIKEQLMNPLTSKEEINKRYEKSKEYINNKNRKDIENELKHFYDIERIFRRIELKTIQPYEFSNLYNSLTSIKKIHDLENKKNTNLIRLIKDMETIFNFEIMSMINLNTIEKSFINKGVNKTIDNLNNEIIKIEKDIQKIMDDIGELFQLRKSEQEGLYIEITLNKLKQIEEPLKNYEIINTKKLKNSKKFTIKEIDELNDKLTLLQDKIIKETKSIYLEYIENMDREYNAEIRKEINYIAHLEFYINNAKLFENKAYSIPQIEDIEENFYEAHALRHPIVETIEKEIFVPNDIQFGNEKNMNLNIEKLYEGEKINGYLLYGQNSSGKTVLSKSIGISIILAQAGFFVPAKSLRYSIFKSIFTRISGSDNLSKGLSTFAVEMIELKNILNRADEKSLIIGDEISHGTETISGLSIVAATVLSLKEKNSSFIIATHLHQLSSVSEIENTEEISSVHLSMIYDEQEDKIKYNRKLQKGRGSSIYGLEFAKSLKLPNEFLEKAYKVRKEVSNDLSGLEELTKKRKSRYNSSVFIGVCEQCGKRAEDVHHLIEQKNADKNGLIDYFHKNHKANLRPLCKECHKKEHEKQK